MHFADLFGSEIYKVGLTISDPVRAGGKGSWSGTIDYNQFIDEHRELRNAALQDMKVEWLPAAIIFSDGSHIGEEEQ